METVMKKGDEVNDGDIRRTTFKVEGMDCADEVRLIEDKLGGAVQYRERSFQYIQLKTALVKT